MGRALTIDERRQLLSGWSAEGTGARLADDWDALVASIRESLPEPVRRWLKTYYKDTRG